MTVVAYYTKMKGLWDELATYSTIPNCTCGAAKKFVIESEIEKVYQFLMGIDDNFGVIHSQIFMSTDPLQTLAKVYALVSQ